MTRVLLGSLAVVACLVGCTGGASKPTTPVAATPPPKTPLPAKGQSLLPLKKGNQWIYTSDVRSSQGNTGGEMTWRISAVKPVSGGLEATMEMLQGGAVIDRQVWRSTDKGIYQVSAGMKGTRFSPVQPLITFPLKENGTFNYSGNGLTPFGSPGTLQSKGRTVGMQEIDIEGGRVQALAVESSIQFTAGKTKGLAQTTTWFQPGVGVVRYRMDIDMGAAQGSTVLRLKSTNVKP